MCFRPNGPFPRGPGEVTRRQRDKNWKTDWNLVKLHALKKELPPDPLPLFNLIYVTESRREKDEAGFIDQVTLA